jgi:hypothetical protein
MTEPAPRPSLWSDLQRLSAVAGALTAVALLVSGAGPGLLLTALALLGLDDGVGLVGNIVATAPLSLTVGLLLIRATSYRGEWSIGSVLAGLILASWVSREAAIALGQMTRADIDLPPAGSSMTDPFYYARVIGATIAAFFETYGATRFALAIAGSLFLVYAYHTVLLPRLRRPSPE